MKKKSFAILFIFLFISCSNISRTAYSGITQIKSVKGLLNSANQNYSFYFDLLEDAETYYIYFSEIDDISTAKLLIKGENSPLIYTYSRDSRYGNKEFYFWIKAHNGKNFGIPSSSFKYSLL